MDNVLLKKVIMIIQKIQQRYIIFYYLFAGTLPPLLTVTSPHFNTYNAGNADI